VIDGWHAPCSTRGVAIRSTKQAQWPVGALALLLLLSAGEAEALEQMHQLSLGFGKAVRARCLAGMDLVTARIEISRVARGALDRVGHSAKIGPYQLRFRQGLKGQVVGRIAAGQGFVRCRVRKQGANLLLQIGVLDGRWRLRELKRSILGELPWSREAATQEAEIKVRRLARQKFHDWAIDYLKDLRQRRAALEDYCLIRTADTHVLAGRIPTAYAQYVAMNRSLTDLQPKLLARTRAAELGYLVDGKLPEQQLVKSLMGARGDFGRLARRRIARIMLHAGKYGRALRLVLEGQGAETQTLREQIVLAAQRHSLWRSDPFRAAVFHQVAYRRLIDPQRQVEEMILSGRAFLQLGLPLEAAKLLLKALTETKEIRTKERTLPPLIAAYIAADQHYRGRQAADYYLGHFPQGPSEDAVLEQRAELLLHEGDLKGAARDLARLAPTAAPRLRASLVLLSGGQQRPDDETFKRVSRLAARQARLLKKLEATR
jgi:hypothetical protein